MSFSKFRFAWYCDITAADQSKIIQHPHLCLQHISHLAVFNFEVQSTDLQHRFQWELRSQLHPLKPAYMKKVEQIRLKRGDFVLHRRGILYQTCHRHFTNSVENSNISPKPIKGCIKSASDEDGLGSEWQRPFPAAEVLSLSDIVKFGIRPAQVWRVSMWNVWWQLCLCETHRWWTGGMCKCSPNYQARSRGCNIVLIYNINQRAWFYSFNIFSFVLPLNDELWTNHVFGNIWSEVQTSCSSPRNSFYHA